MIILSSTIPADVGACATHVKADDGDLRLRVVGGEGVPDDTTGRTGENCTETRKDVDIDKTAVALHELASRALVSGLFLHALGAKTASKPLLKPSMYFLMAGVR